jgi:hypothetical protein
MARGARLEVDGRLGDVPCKDVWGNSYSPDAILVSSSASSLYWRGTWLSSIQ